MLQKITVTTFALGALLTGSLALAQTGSTHSTSSVQAGTGSTTPLVKPLPVIFPIAELGGCTSKDACKIYCDGVTRREACLVYAQTHGLMRPNEIAKARAFIKEHIASTSVDSILVARGGPGGCSTRYACKTFCDDSANSEVCLQFAKEHKLMTTEQIGLAKKLAGQIGPGGCKGEECKTYCQNSEHQQVCIEFARQNGFISQDDAQKRLEGVRMSSTTRSLPPLNVNNRDRMSSTTPLGPKPNLDTARLKGLCNTIDECKKVCMNNPSLCIPSTSSGTRPQTFNENQKQQPSGTPGATNTTDRSKPPYNCTPAQAAEGACEPPSTASDQGGSVFLSILHFFGL